MILLSQWYSYRNKNKNTGIFFLKLAEKIMTFEEWDAVTPDYGQLTVLLNVDRVVQMTHCLTLVPEG